MVNRVDARKENKKARSHARTVRIRNNEDTRAKIQAGVIIKYLQDHVLGKKEMSSTQVAAAKILMDKTLPNLAQTDINADVNNKNYVVSSEAMSEDDWLNTNERKDLSNEQIH